MKGTFLALTALILCSTLLLHGSRSFAQRSGQSIQVQYGVVVSSRYVQEQSDAGKATLVGGTVGYYANRNKSRSTKAPSTAVGAGLAAKQELIAADTDAAVDRALRKVSILCDD